MKVIVVGAGIIGASVALRLAQSGARVTLVEANRPASGTSQVSFAWVSACEKIGSDDYYRLSCAGVKAHHELVAEFGEAGTWYKRPGVIQWDFAAYEDVASAGFPAEKKMKRLAELGYRAEVIDADQLRALEPSLAEDALQGGKAVHYPEDGYIEAPVYIGRLLDAAVRSYGVRLMQSSPVSRVVLHDRQARGVELASGEVIEADVVVNCAGRWANDVVGHKELKVPLAPTVGLIAYTPSLPATIRKVLRTPQLNLRTDGGGRLMLRANDIDGLVGETDAELPTHPVAETLIRRLWRLVPELHGAPLEAVRIGVRPIPRDGLPCVGTIPGIDGYWVAVTHGGVNTSAFIGQALRDEILHDQPAAEYAPFRPARFFKAAA